MDMVTARSTPPKLKRLPGESTLAWTPLKKTSGAVSLFSSTFGHTKQHGSTVNCPLTVNSVNKGESLVVSVGVCRMGGKRLETKATVNVACLQK